MVNAGLLASRISQTNFTGDQKIYMTNTFKLINKRREDAGIKKIPYLNVKNLRCRKVTINLAYMTDEELNIMDDQLKAITQITDVYDIIAKDVNLLPMEELIKLEEHIKNIKQQNS